MKKNLNVTDRISRLLIAIALLAFAVWQHSWVVFFASLFVFFEAAAGWCILYALTGKSSCPISNAASTQPPASKNVSAYASVNGQKIYYEVHGEGEPLVLIAGFTCNSLIWSLILKDLAARFKVIIFDNRGAGRSSSPDKEYTTKDMADDVAALIDFLKLGRVNVMGHSMGGAVAQELAYHYRDKVKKLILACTSAHFSKRCIFVERFVYSMMKQGIKRDVQVDYILPWVYSDSLLENEQAVQSVRQTVINEPYVQSVEDFSRQFKALEMFDSTAWIKQIKAPTLVLYGTDDVLCLNDHHFILKEIEGAERYLFEGIGHLPHLEQPKRFAECIINFL